MRGKGYVESFIMQPITAGKGCLVAEMDLKTEEILRATVGGWEETVRLFRLSP